MCQSDIDKLLESKLLDAGSGAYAGLDAQIRAKLKSAITLLHRFWGESVFEQRTSTMTQEGGFCISERVSPRPWAMFIFDEEYASAPGLVAAFMPAILAKVPNILPCILSRRSGCSVSEPVSAVLELLGLEDVYGLNYYEVVKLVQGLVGRTGADSGAVVLLGSNSFFADIAGQCLQHRLPTMTLPARMKLGVEHGCEVDSEFMAWAYPHAELETLTPLSDVKEFFAVFTNKPVWDACHGYACKNSVPPRLRIRPGNEHLWIWPKLDPDFFCMRELCIF